MFLTPVYMTLFNMKDEYGAERPSNLRDEPISLGPFQNIQVVYMSHIIGISPDKKETWILFDAEDLYKYDGKLYGEISIYTRSRSGVASYDISEWPYTRFKDKPEDVSDFSIDTMWKKGYVHTWREVDERIFNNQLGVLPPYQTERLDDEKAYAFAVGEPAEHENGGPVHTVFVRLWDPDKNVYRYFGKNCIMFTFLLGKIQLDIAIRQIRGQFMMR